MKKLIVNIAVMSMVAVFLFGASTQAIAQQPVPIGGEFQVNTYTTAGQGGPAVAMDSSGNFVVTWRSNGSPGTDNDNNSIQGQVFNAQATPVGADFQVRDTKQPVIVFVYLDAKVGTRFGVQDISIRKQKSISIPEMWIPRTLAREYVRTLLR